MLGEGLFGSLRDENATLDAFILNLYADNSSRLTIIRDQRRDSSKKSWNAAFRTSWRGRCFRLQVHLPRMRRDNFSMAPQ